MRLPEQKLDNPDSHQSSQFDLNASPTENWSMVFNSRLRKFERTILKSKGEAVAPSPILSIRNMPLTFEKQDSKDKGLVTQNHWTPSPILSKRGPNLCDSLERFRPKEEEEEDELYMWMKPRLWNVPSMLKNHCKNISPTSEPKIVSAKNESVMLPKISENRIVPLLSSTRNKEVKETASFAMNTRSSFVNQRTEDINLTQNMLHRFTEKNWRGRSTGVAQNKLADREIRKRMGMFTHIENTVQGI